MAIENNEGVLERLAERLSLDEDIVIAIAFGSIVTGGLRPDSDVDIAILTQQPLNTQRRQELICLLADITGRPVDLVNLRTAGVTVMRSLLKHGKRLVCKDRRAYDSLVSRMLVDVADFLPYHQRLLKERRKAWIR